MCAETCEVEAARQIVFNQKTKETHAKVQQIYQLFSYNVAHRL